MFGTPLDNHAELESGAPAFWKCMTAIAGRPDAPTATGVSVSSSEKVERCKGQENARDDDRKPELRDDGRQTPHGRRRFVAI